MSLTATDIRNLVLSAAAQAFAKRLAQTEDGG